MPSDMYGRRGHRASAFTLADPLEVANYFLWRQRDCVRNSITMAAQAKFPQPELHGRSTGQMQEMLWAGHGINWNDYDAGAKRGRVVVRETGRREVAYRDGRTGEAETVLAVRSWWETREAPHFTADPDGWLAAVIPAMPSPTAGRTT
ncbi:hypothetical protein ACQPZZ_17560 [Microbispora sp. CA-135349]|uniref:hypothetical protein n=1 Tax=Microbispora sp. CA-135349 TaxID=3239953 RepID=UPI003D8E9BBC